MFDLSTYLDLPLIWGILIATAIFLYVCLDGFDLGCGILFPFAPSDECRNRIMNSIAPFWDGNETWLILGGGGLFAAFPVAYAILMPAFYLPIIIMLLGLIFRGVAFEFRFKSANSGQRKIWDVVFHSGSLIAAFMQGVILGNFVLGIEVSERSFAGGPLDWANGFAILTGLGVIVGYALLGSCWLIMKTCSQTQNWARSVSRYVLPYVAIFMIIVSISMPFIDERIREFWFSMPNILFLSPIPIVTFVAFLILWLDLSNEKQENRPFFLVILLFMLAFLGLAISLYPWIIPFKFTIWQAAAYGKSLSLLLVGTVIFLPVILGYTAYSYYVFRGKTDEKSLY